MTSSPKHRIRVDAQGRALVPKPLRDALGIDVPSEAIAWVEDGRLVVEPRASVLARVRARYRGVRGSLAQRIGDERREGDGDNERG